MFVFKMRKKSKREDKRPKKKKRSQVENWQDMTKSTTYQI